MRKLVLAVLFFIANNLMFASIPQIKQTIRGEIIDSQTKTTLPGASIILLGSEPLRGTTSDEQGRFRIENIEIGRVSILVRFMGYHNVVLNNLELEAGRELVLHIEMKESGIMAQEVTITAHVDKSLSVNQQTSVSARSFTVEETERYAGSFNDVARMAANYAGVMGNDDARNDIIIRGNSPTGLLWRLEGVDIPNPNHWGMPTTTGGPVSMLNNTLLGNSDFLTGAFPAEYGNALSGVFDLRMRNGNNEKYEFIGQIGFNGVEFGAEGPVNIKKGSSFLVNYRYSTLGLFEKLGMDFGTVGVPYYQDLSFKVNFPNTKLGRLSVFGLGGKSDIEIFDSRKDTINKPLDLYGAEGFDITSASDMAVVGINQLYHINDNTFSRFTLAAMGQLVSTRVDTITPQTREIAHFYGDRLVENRLFASYGVSKRFSYKHNIKLGVTANFMQANLKDSVYYPRKQTFESRLNFKGSSQRMQSYAQWQFKPTNNLTFNTGLHHMYYFLNSHHSIEPRIGMRWQAAPKHAFSLGYGLHSQAASSIIYFYSPEDASPENLRPNKNLNFTKSNHYIAGYDFRINEFTRIKTEIYLQKIFDAPIDAMNRNAYSLLNQGSSFEFELADYMKNGGTGSNKGIELTLEQFLNKGFYYLITASLFDSKYVASNNIEHNSAFNNNHVVNGLIGKEFEIRKGHSKSKQLIAIDFKTTHSGGVRTTPWVAVFNPATNEYHREYDYTRAYSVKLKDYLKSDLTLTFKSNSDKITQHWGLQITNLTNQANVHSESFNTKTGESKFAFQPGRLIIPHYRIIF
jgi:hypothetical protein